MKWQFNPLLSPWMGGCWDISDSINNYDVLTLNNFLLSYKSRDANIGNYMKTDQIN